MNTFFLPYKSASLPKNNRRHPYFQRSVPSQWLPRRTHGYRAQTVSRDQPLQFLFGYSKVSAYRRQRDRGESGVGYLRKRRKRDWVNVGPQSHWNEVRTFTTMAAVQVKISTMDRIRLGCSGLLALFSSSTPVCPWTEPSLPCTRSKECRSVDVPNVS